MKQDKQKKTTKQKFLTFLKVLLGIAIAIAIIAAITAMANVISVKSSKNFISTIKQVEYTDQLVPKRDKADGNYTYITDNDFKVMQLTDVHIGAGFLSSKKDIMAINAVEAMIREEKPDLVIVTGDIAFPVPFIAGTFNNKNPAIIFADLMEQMGVYWAPVFGNHDTEAYSYYTRSDIGEIYANQEKYPHCLFEAGPEDVFGCGNYLVKVKNSAGKITRAYIMMDSNAYLGNDMLGVLWNYDCIHEDQIKWYSDQIELLTKENNGDVPKSLLFFHIPLAEMKTAYEEYKENDFNNTADSKYLFGKVGEKDAGIFASDLNYGFFNKVKEMGSTQGMFFGHDHLNSFSMMYKGIQMTYGYSIDYLAYSGISKFGTQRGCTIITSSQDGNYTITQENYYQDKYQSINKKEAVSMEDMYRKE